MLSSKNDLIPSTDLKGRTYCLHLGFKKGRSGIVCNFFSKPGINGPIGARDPGNFKVIVCISLQSLTDVEELIIHDY